MTWDVLIGFFAEPKNLEEFLNSQGYLKTKENNYHHNELDVDIDYSLIKKGSEEEKMWMGSPTKIISEININYPRDGFCWEEVQRIADLLVEKYHALNKDEFVN